MEPIKEDIDFKEELPTLSADEIASSGNPNFLNRAELLELARDDEASLERLSQFKKLINPLDIGIINSSEALAKSSELSDLVPSGKSEAIPNAPGGNSVNSGDGLPGDISQSLKNSDSSAESPNTSMHFNSHSVNPSTAPYVAEPMLSREGIRIIPYIERVKSEHLNGCNCYPGDEEKFTKIEKDSLHNIKTELAQLSSVLAVTADRFAFIDRPETQSAQRRANSMVYLNDITRSLDQISDFFHYPEMFSENHPESRASIRPDGWHMKLLRMLGPQHSKEYVLLMNFQETKEPLTNLAKTILAFVRRSLLLSMYHCSDIRIDMSNILRPEFISKKSLLELDGLLKTNKRFLARVTQFLLRPEEVAAARDSYRTASPQHYSTYKQIIDNYKTDLANVWVENPVIIESKRARDGIRFDCKELDPNNLPVGFIPCAGEFYEYEFFDPKRQATRRAPAKFVPFLRGQWNLENYSILPVCRNDGCYEPKHHIFMLSRRRENYLFCFGGNGCQHKEKCPVAGRALEFEGVA